MARKLTDREVLHVRDKVLSGKATRKEMARSFGVALETIARIMRGDSHQHLGLTTREEWEEQEARITEGIAGSQARLLELLAQADRPEEVARPEGVSDEVLEKARSFGAQI